MNKMIEEYPYATAKIRASSYDNKTLCGEPPKNYMNLVRDVHADLPWTGMLFGLTINSIWYWCTDQVSSIAPFNF